MASGDNSSAPLQIRRPGYGASGRPVRLKTNHFAVTLTGSEDVGQYSVSISFADDPNAKKLVEKTTNRRVMEKVKAELGGRKLIFDGENTLYALGGLPFSEKELDISLERADASSSGGGGKRRRTDGSSYKVMIKFSVKVEMGVLMKKEELHLSRAQDAIRVLDVLMREQAARRDYMLLRESYFHESLGDVGQIGDGLQSWNGYHTSFRPTSLGLSLNLDPSTTIVLKPQMVHEFVAEYLRKFPNRLGSEDLPRVKRILKGIAVEVYAGTKHKIFGFSDQPAASQEFELKEKGDDGSFRLVSTTVEQYYRGRYNETLQHPHLPCVNVGKATRPVFIPMEFCKILPGQRYKKKLVGQQTANHINQSRMLPEKRAQVIQKGIDALLANAEVDLRSFNVKVEKNMLTVPGRVLSPPTLKFGSRNSNVERGRWNYNHDVLARPAEISTWIVLSFGRSSYNDVSSIADRVQQCCNRKGLKLQPPNLVMVEDRRFQGAPAFNRVKKMLEDVKPKLKGAPRFVLCILQDKESDIYAPFKKIFLTEEGIVNQCMVPPRNMNDQYLTNLALKINAKLGGYNSVLVPEFDRRMPKLSEKPTMILGMDVSHSSPFSNTPSLAAMVGSYDWPRITKYAARVMSQSAKQEAFANVTPMLEGLLKNFNGGKSFPEHLLVFRCHL